MNLLQLAKSTLVKKEGYREENGEIKEFEYMGYLYEELSEHFTDSAEIEFDKSMKALKAIQSLDTDFLRLKNEVSLIDIETQVLLSRMKLVDSIEDHKKITSLIQTAATRQSKLSIEINNNEMNKFEKIIKILDLKITDTNFKFDIDKIETTVLLNIVLLVTSFFTNKKLLK